MKQHRDHFHEQDDAALVASTLAGERDAFDVLLERYAASVQRLCTTLLGTTVEAQDIAQEAALQAFLGLSHLREPACFADCPSLGNIWSSCVTQRVREVCPSLLRNQSSMHLKSPSVPGNMPTPSLCPRIFLSVCWSRLRRNFSLW
jgi:hypothetical protein